MSRRLLHCVGLLLVLVPSLFGAQAGAPPAPLRVVIVGGGPAPEDNQVAIESNVRYLGRLLPQGTVRTTLFADGDLSHATVLYADDDSTAGMGERILSLALDGDGEGAGFSHYRTPNLGGALDGPSGHAAIGRVFERLRAEESVDPKPVLLYFTGHGSSNGDDLENNRYDLWREDRGLSVRELARYVGQLPAQAPVTVVMVQCFSGAFGNLVFEGGDPHGEPIDRDIAGFYATVKERVAAGCTSAVNEADYHDFTSYFFAALTGRDRVGRRVTGADYDHDGRVEMNEAYCYTLVHDDSIDVPVCTSDVFLRRYALLRDAEVFRTPYRSVLRWADPAQRAALDGLSASLGLTGDQRLAHAYSRMVEVVDADGGGAPRGDRAVERRFEQLQRDSKSAVLRRWPDLRLGSGAPFEAAKRSASAALDREAEAPEWKALLDANDAWNRSADEEEKREISDSRLIRFVRLSKSVVLAHALRESGSPTLTQRFDRLIADEHGCLLVPSDAEPIAKAPSLRTSLSALQRSPARRFTPASVAIAQSDRRAGKRPACETTVLRTGAVIQSTVRIMQPMLRRAARARNRPARSVIASRRCSSAWTMVCQTGRAPARIVHASGG